MLKVKDRSSQHQLTMEIDFLLSLPPLSLLSLSFSAPTANAMFFFSSEKKMKFFLLLLLLFCCPCLLYDSRKRRMSKIRIEEKRKLVAVVFVVVVLVRICFRQFRICFWFQHRRRYSSREACGGREGERKEGRTGRKRSHIVEKRIDEEEEASVLFIANRLTMKRK